MDAGPALVFPVFAVARTRPILQKPAEIDLACPGVPSGVLGKFEKKTKVGDR
jgi:hypothetical protein